MGRSRSSAHAMEASLENNAVDSKLVRKSTSTNVRGRALMLALEDVGGSEN